MSKAKNKNLKGILSIVCITVIVILLVVMPLLAGQSQKADGPTASILSATVEKGSVKMKLIGGGTLAEEDAVKISVPASVKLKNYLVSNGNRVREGDPIASVDRVTVMTAISEVQETLDYLAEQIEKESKKKTDEEVVALAGGTVKILYAEEGASVQDIMLEHGALAVLSLDGRMAVDLTAESDLSAGTAVTLTFEDGSIATGKIESNLAGEITVTVDDDGYTAGETVQISTADGTDIGSGELYIYSPWNATAYAGTIDSVKISEGDTVDAGEILMKLTDTGYTAAYRQLVNKRQAYEELMLELFELYQTETITAPCDGIVSGVDKDSPQLLSANKQAYTVTFLANAPNGDDETLYINYVGKVTAVGRNGWALSVNPQSMEIADYRILSGILLDTAAMTDIFAYNPNQAEGSATPVYELQNGAWVQIDTATITAGDILLFAGDSSGDFVWIVRIQKSVPDSNSPETPTDPNTPTNPDATTNPGIPTGPNTPQNPGTPNESNTPKKPGIPTNPGTTFPSAGGTWNGAGGYPQYGSNQQEPEYELYGLDVCEIAAVTPQKTMTLDISVNELDVSALSIGMTADVHISTLGGEKLTATITDISNTGSNNGGYSYYTVKLTMERKENMLAGMNATATIITATIDDVLTIPAEALVEEGTRTIVYTGYDEENEALINPVEVSIGASDGQTVEIVDGLKAGETCYYAYYDTLDVSSVPDFSSGGFGRFGRFAPGR